MKKEIKESPIIFSGDMINAILTGKKTQTRRVIKNPLCPYGEKGDRMWVRESCYIHNHPNEREPNGTVYYVADIGLGKGGKATPSIYMPRWASRINLEINGVFVERLKNISTTDAIAEGILEWKGNVNIITQNIDGTIPITQFHLLWDSINEKRGFGWDSNPLVWVIEFKVINIKGR